MPTMDVPRARRWRFRLSGAHDAQPGQYKAHRPITEDELRRRLAALFCVKQLPAMDCWPEGEVEYVDAD